jgi:hypothetical protein
MNITIARLAFGMLVKVVAVCGLDDPGVPKRWRCTPAPVCGHELHGCDLLANLVVVAAALGVLLLG